MDQTLHSYMRVGLVHAAIYAPAVYGPQAADGLAEIAADAFFEVLEIRRHAAGPPGQSLVGALRSSRIGLVYDACTLLLEQQLDLSSADEAARTRALATAKQAIDEAHAAGAERINVTGGPDPGPAGHEQAAESLVDSLYELAAYAAGHALALALQPFPRAGGTVALVGPTAEAAGLVRLVREVYPEVSLTLDTGHLAALDEDELAAFTTAAPHLRQVTLANIASTDAPGAPRRVVDGGDFAVSALTASLLALFRVGYLGSGRRPLVVIRASPHLGEQPTATIAAVKHTLLQAWAAL